MFIAVCLLKREARITPGLEGYMACSHVRKNKEVEKIVIPSGVPPTHDFDPGASVDGNATKSSKFGRLLGTSVMREKRSKGKPSMK